MIFVVNLTCNQEGKYIADKTPTEIYSAYQEGYNVIAKCNNNTYQISGLCPQSCQAVNDKSYEVFVIKEDRTVDYYAGSPESGGANYVVYDNVSIDTTPIVPTNPITVDSGVVRVKLPKGRMKGDINGDGYIDEGDYQLLFNYNTDPDSYPLDETQLLCADINNDGKVNNIDTSKLFKIANGNLKIAAAGPEIFGNWIINPNYETEAAQFYYDVPLENMTDSSTASLLISKYADRFIGVECLDGAARIKVSLCPIEEVDVTIIWSADDAKNWSII